MVYTIRTVSDVKVDCGTVEEEEVLGGGTVVGLWRGFSHLRGVHSFPSSRTLEDQIPLSMVPPFSFSLVSVLLGVFRRLHVYKPLMSF